jgi:hypothetical protein
MGKYCKAFPLSEFRKFESWSEQIENLRKDEEPLSESRAQGHLADDDYLFLQENFIVTDGVFQDENVIFDNITPNWINFCTVELKFQAPTDDITEETPQPESSTLSEQAVGGD